MAKIRKFKSNDYIVNYSKGWNGVLVGLRKLLQLNFEGGSNYANYETSKGILSLRLSDHNANGNNFNTDHINISVYVALIEYKHVETRVKYIEYRITKETYDKYPPKVVYEIVAAVERALNGEVFELNDDIAERTSYEIEI